MFKFFLRILIFIYCFVFLSYFFIQEIENNNIWMNIVSLVPFIEKNDEEKSENINNNEEPDIQEIENNENINNNEIPEIKESEKKEFEKIKKDEIKKLEEKLEIPDKIFIEGIPFTTQSPFADWENSMEQDGCEEASSIMAMKWIKNEKLEKKDALDYILDISEYIENKYGEYRDVSVYDIKNWIFNDYFEYENIDVLENITKENIIGELNNNRILLIPTNGRILKNPNFVSPGPKTHMLVVLGYDISKNIFIVNDPGTRLGKNYEYDMDILYNAIYSYPTGYHEDAGFIEKNIISVWK
jgi:hypothetical protein